MENSRASKDLIYKRKGMTKAVAGKMPKKRKGSTAPC